jgi:hypothetical protein
MEKLLFFDDHFLTISNNIKRGTTKPKMLSESLYFDPYMDEVNLRWGYPFVFKDEASGKWRMLYQGWSVEREHHPYVVALAAESDDGLHWEPTNTTAWLSLDDRKFPHQILPLHMFGGIFGESQFFVDYRASAEERYKALAIYRLVNFEFKSCIFVSADGLRWTLKEGAEWHKGSDAPDQHMRTEEYRYVKQMIGPTFLLESLLCSRTLWMNR